MANTPPPDALPPGTGDDRSWVAIFTVVLCLSVATFMVGLRIYTRAFVTKPMGVDDWAAIITLVRLAPPRGIGRESTDPAADNNLCRRYHYRYGYGTDHVFVRQSRFLIMA